MPTKPVTSRSIPVSFLVSRTVVSAINSPGLCRHPVRAKDLRDDMRSWIRSGSGTNTRATCLTDEGAAALNALHQAFFFQGVDRLADGAACQFVLLHQSGL